MGKSKYIVIQDWMIDLVGGTMTDVVTYAIVYQFSADGLGVYFGKSEYIAQWLGVDPVTVNRCLKRLRDRGLVTCDIGGNGKRNVNYRVVEPPMQNAPVAMQNAPVAMQNASVLNNVYNKSYKEKDNKKDTPRDERGDTFDFYQALLDLGVTEQTARDWMEVRKRKKAVNSRTAFDEVKMQIQKAGLPAEECIRTSAANSWYGFKADYVKDRPRPEGTFMTPEQYIESLKNGSKK